MIIIPVKSTFSRPLVLEETAGDDDKIHPEFWCKIVTLSVSISLLLNMLISYPESYPRHLEDQKLRVENCYRKHHFKVKTRTRFTQKRMPVHQENEQLGIVSGRHQKTSLFQQMSPFIQKHNS